MTVTFSPEKLKRFKRVYNKLASTPEATFNFEGNEYLVGYAKYLIEYLETPNPKAFGLNPIVLWSKF